jgi:hypothetical protein
MQPTSLAVTPTAPRAVARDAPVAPALTLAADTRSVRRHPPEAWRRIPMGEDLHGFLDYFKLPFALMGADLLRSGYDFDAPHRRRREFWSVVPPGRYSPLEIRPLLKSYMTALETEIQASVGHGCLAYWLHLYRRLFPGCIGRNKKPATAVLVRSSLEAAFQKFAPAESQGRIGTSTEVAPSAILGGLLMSEELRKIREFVVGSPMLVLTDFGTNELRELYDLEKLAYEVWRTAALLRITGKGAPVIVDGSEHVLYDDRSDDLDDSVVMFDERNERGAGALASHTATVFPGDCTTEGTAVLPHYNAGGFVYEGDFLEALGRVLGAKLAGPYKPNFLWTPMNLRGYYEAHKPFSDAFSDLHGVSLESVLCLVAALARRTFLAWALEGGPWIIHQMQRGYEGPRTRDYILEELGGFVDEGASLLGLDASLAGQVDIESALDFWTLDDGTRSLIDIACGGPHSLFIPMGESSYYIDWAWLSRRLMNLYFDVKLDDQNFKGKALENRVRGAEQTLPYKPCVGRDGTSKQVDASYRLGDWLVIAECRAFWKSIAFELGDPEALAYRKTKVDKALGDVDDKAAWLAERPVGVNYDVSWATLIVPVAVTPFAEYLPIGESEYWLSERQPRERMQPTSLAVTPTAPRAVARDAPAAPALTLAADTRSVR